MVTVAPRLQKAAKDAAYVFVGNRIFVLDEMLRMKLKIDKVFAVRGSHLERQLGERGFPCVAVETKAQLLGELAKVEFDVLVSNGCPFLLPVAGYRKPDAVLVNIHPSYLPDLRGKDPVPGALLYRRDSGATCHRIDAGIDTGEIVAQVKISYSDDLDVGILYQLSFLAEKDVFGQAFARGFAPIGAQPAAIDLIYYSRSPGDQLIDFEKDDLDLIVRKVSAYGNRSQGVRFFAGGHEFKTFVARALRNRYLMEKAAGYRENEIMFCYEDVLVVRKGDSVLKLERVVGPLDKLKPRSLVTQA